MAFEYDEKTRLMMQDVGRIVVLFLLVSALWFVAVATGFLRCSAVPGGCEIYYGVLRASGGGKEKVLVVYGDGGMGDHELLVEKMNDPDVLRVRPRTLHLQQTSLQTLRNFDLVVVEEAREISTEKLQMFMEYVNGGGRLVWTGDAGTELAESIDYNVDIGIQKLEDKLVKEKEVYADSNSNRFVNVWARKRQGMAILFNNFLSVDYIGSYCSIRGLSEEQCQRKLPELTENEKKLLSALKCMGAWDDLSAKTVEEIARLAKVPIADVENLVSNLLAKKLVERSSKFNGFFVPRAKQFYRGNLKPEPESDHKLIYALAEDLPFDGDFAVVESRSDIQNRIVLSLDIGSKIPRRPPKQLPKELVLIPRDLDKLGSAFPIIVSAGGGERVVYYAVPPEQFVSPDKDMCYPSIIQNLYYGMLR